MRIAIVHDFLYTFGGAEQVLKAMLECYPEAEVFSLFDVLSDADRTKIGIRKSHTSFLQKMPQIHKRHRLYMPLMPIAIEQLDLSRFDLIISSSYAVAKGIITGPDQLHISYIHSPMRYAWDLQEQYLKESKRDKGIKGIIARTLLHYMRLWDVRTSNSPNSIICNSHFVARRIKKIYGRDATVIYPPVRVPTNFIPRKTDMPITQYEKYFFTASRLVPYKNIHLIVEAFKYLPDQRLIVAGKGPDLDRIKKLAGFNVEFVGFVSDAQMQVYMKNAEAFIFAAEEDFGIIPLEAQAQGTPVIGLSRGGLRETIIEGGDNPTGVFFNDANAMRISTAVRTFLERKQELTAENCFRNALRFNENRFKEQFTDYVTLEIDRFNAMLDATRAKPLVQVEGEIA